MCIGVTEWDLKATWLTKIKQLNNWGISCELDRNMEIY